MQNYQIRNFFPKDLENIEKDLRKKLADEVLNHIPKINSFYDSSKKECDGNNNGSVFTKIDVLKIIFCLIDSLAKVAGDNPVPTVKGIVTLPKYNFLFLWNEFDENSVNVTDKCIRFKLPTNIHTSKLFFIQININCDNIVLHYQFN